MYPSFEYYAQFDRGYSNKKGALAYLIKNKKDKII